MPLIRPAIRRLAILAVLVVGGALVVARVPALSIGGVTARTGAIAGVVSGLLLVPSVVSHYWSGEYLRGARWALVAVGVPLSLARSTGLSWLGVLLLLLSLGVGAVVDRRVRATRRGSSQ
ncbi:hypothetical protein [Salinigranum sp. GCM10025319]|uniref:hypothetical protein n=1 Tax=Salinigranum sp. GCM10025319 TaxID=3252687 RepID=UPI00360E31AD